MKYRTIVADPPWNYGKQAGRWFPPDDWATTQKRTRPAIPYRPMSTAAICALPVAEMAAPDSCVFLWTTNRHLPEAFGVVAAWGFTYRQTIVWAKLNPTPLGGSLCPNGAEFLLFGRRGKPRLSRWAGSSVISLKASPQVRTHSGKPDTFQDLIEQVSPGPYLELFARRNRMGWHSWGNECQNDVELATA